MRANPLPKPPPPWTVGPAMAGLLLALSMGPLLQGCGSGSRTTSAAAPRLPVPVHRAIAPEFREIYIGSEACVQCHREQAAQSRGRHARTLSRVTVTAHGAAFRRAPAVSDPQLKIVYHTAVKDGRCVFQAVQAGETYEAQPVYAFGSGNLAYTYVGMYEGNPTELRLSYYPALKRWDFTPGQRVGRRISDPVGRKLDSERVNGCFLCHSTMLVQDGPIARPDQSILGVGCESCHGPGKAHLEAVQAGQRDLRMPRLGGHPDEVSRRLCGQCHQGPSIEQARYPTVRAQLPRLQVLALQMSKCTDASGAKLSCLTCHDPHRDSDQLPRAAYNARCRSCHSARVAHAVVCPTKPTGDCVSCHMPEQPVSLPARMVFHTHLIKPWPRPEAISPPADHAAG